MNNNIEVLEEVLDVLEDERKHFLDLVNQNEFRMEEINSYLRELSKSEDEDFKVFSPRNVENMHREQIEADVSEKKKYEEENKEYLKKISFLKKLIDKVNIVIANLQYEEEPDIPEENKNEDKDTLESDHIAHQILNCVSFIIPDADRAKVELTALAKKLSDDTIYRK
ncbi:hypothetical protein D7X98_01750 [bacterium 1XD8-76]|nr:hypothetical protein D7X98_01750 [bacterium 1XD8-76]